MRLKTPWKFHTGWVPVEVKDDPIIRRPKGWWITNIGRNSTKRRVRREVAKMHARFKQA